MWKVKLKYKIVPSKNVAGMNECWRDNCLSDWVPSKVMLMDITKSSKLSWIISLCLIVFAYLFSIHLFLDQFIDIFYCNKFEIGNPYYFQEESIFFMWNACNSYCWIILDIIKFEEHAHCEATIVTAYFKMRSKHTYEEYISWMSNMLGWFWQPVFKYPSFGRVRIIFRVEHF